MVLSTDTYLLLTKSWNNKQMTRPANPAASARGFLSERVIMQKQSRKSSNCFAVCAGHGCTDALQTDSVLSVCSVLCLCSYCVHRCVNLTDRFGLMWERCSFTRRVNPARVSVGHWTSWSGGTHDTVCRRTLFFFNYDSGTRLTSANNI